MKQIILLGIITFLLMFSVTMVYPVLKPFVVERFDTSVSQASLFVSINLLAYVIFAMIWGALSDQKGKRKPFIVLGFFGNALFMILVTFAGTLPVLLTFRFIEGAFSIMAFSLIMTSVLDRAHQVKIGGGIGIVAMSFALGNAIGAPIGGLLGSISPFYPFYAGAFLLCIAGLIASVFLSESQLIKPVPSMLSSLKLLRHDKRLYIPYAFSFIDRFTVGFFVGVFPIFLATKYDADPAQVGMFMFAFLLPFALLQYPGGKLSDSIGRAYPIIIGSVLYGVCVMLVGIVGVTILWMVMFVGGFVGAFMFSPSAALVGDLAPPEKRGAAMGGFNLFGSLGFVLGPFVGGLIADHFSFAASFAFAGISEIIVALIFIPALLKLKAERG